MQWLSYRKTVVMSSLTAAVPLLYVRQQMMMMMRRRMLGSAADAESLRPAAAALTGDEMILEQLSPDTPADWPAKCNRVTNGGTIE